MRITIQSFKLSLSTIFIGILLLPSPTRADGGEDYYKELRKLKKFDKTTLNELKKKTATDEQTKRVNEISQANNTYNKKLSEKEQKSPGNKITKPTNESTTYTSSKPQAPKRSKPREDTSPSAPIKVNSDTPDELSFPGK